MVKVNFYLMKQSDEQARNVLACRLADKLYKQHRRVHIHVSSSENGRELDQLLWTFSADSFVPHTLCTDPAQATTAVVIGWDQHVAASGDLIPVAIARTPLEAAPISGSIFGDPGATNLSVHVDVRPTDSLQEAA